MLVARLHSRNLGAAASASSGPQRPTTFRPSALNTWNSSVAFYGCTLLRSLYQLTKARPNARPNQTSLPPAIAYCPLRVCTHWPPVLHTFAANLCTPETYNNGLELSTPGPPSRNTTKPPPAQQSPHSPALVSCCFPPPPAATSPLRSAQPSPASGQLPPSRTPPAPRLALPRRPPNAPAGPPP